MTHNNNQRRFSLKTQARKGTAALLSIALIAALTGCESLSYMGNAVQTAGGYAFDKAEAGYRAVEGLETKTVGRVRSSNFAQTRDEALSMKVQAKSLYLRASANGSGLTDESIESANKFLLSQGPIRRQVLTVVPLSERGEKLARRLAEALEEAGAQEPKLAVYVNEKTGKRDFPDRRVSWDLELISEAYVVHAPECEVADPTRWTIEPYEAVGTLGCANIAMMVSDPKDLLRPRALEGADGTASNLAVQKYQTGDQEDLIDIDFSQED
ncbi:CpaD family pilus assembly lipoprotein [Sutterella wadsworthensis]|uniref:CpaD family pilus assembly lipoprotein n=1 Tax=Sutterella wadsworthensis TaxID=40545 RepID=UPI001D071C98|nr:CpaD family pilus assembly lipoprotein [Sutterella wadsworthensis]MCB7456566.1 CpaD family pilus assembly lipoprotein [Sutterella wadsworthensis]